MDTPPDAGRPFLALHDIRKSFGGVQALKGVSLAILPGRIYHLMGENGCGKSTLIKIVSGAQPADSGRMEIDGRPVEHLTAIGSLAAGIETVYQDLSLIPNLSVAENVGLAQLLVHSGGSLARPLRARQMHEAARRGLLAVQLPTDRAFLNRPVADLPIATRQLVAIARAVASDARLVIMDEPTTALTRREVENLVRVIHGLRESGVAVLLVTHKLDECKQIGGRAIILRDGLKVAECDVAEHTKAELGFWMTGRTLDDGRTRAEPRIGTGLLEVEGLWRRGAFEPVSFALRRGEIVGITGLLDSGRNELALALAGVEPADGGRIALDGQNLALRRPADAIASGIGYVPEDRLSEGLFTGKTIRDNVAVVVLRRLRNAWGLLDASRRDKLARDTIADLRIATPSVELPIEALSGGNQQRVLIGRWLTIAPRLLILHGPTVGVDVGSKDTIFRIIQRLADEGLGVILVSDDLPELLANCDRVMVMRKGVLAETLDAATLDEDRLYGAMIAEKGEEVRP